MCAKESKRCCCCNGMHHYSLPLFPSEQVDEVLFSSADAQASAPSPASHQRRGTRLRSGASAGRPHQFEHVPRHHRHRTTFSQGLCVHNHWEINSLLSIRSATKGCCGACLQDVYYRHAYTPTLLCVSRHILALSAQFPTGVIPLVNRHRCCVCTMLAPHAYHTHSKAVYIESAV